MPSDARLLAPAALFVSADVAHSVRKRAHVGTGWRLVYQQKALDIEYLDSMIAGKFNALPKSLTQILGKKIVRRLATIRLRSFPGMTSRPALAQAGCWTARGGFV
jgi:hypothetical protein